MDGVGDKRIGTSLSKGLFEGITIDEKSEGFDKFVFSLSTPWGEIYDNWYINKMIVGWVDS